MLTNYGVEAWNMKHLLAKVLRLQQDSDVQSYAFLGALWYLLNTSMQIVPTKLVTKTVVAYCLQE